MKNKILHTTLSVKIDDQEYSKTFDLNSINGPLTRKKFHTSVRCLIPILEAFVIDSGVIISEDWE